MYHGNVVTSVSRFPYFILMLTILFSFTLQAQSSLDLKELFCEIIDRNEGYGGGTLLVSTLYSGEIYSKTHGNISRISNNPMKQSSLYEIASITKSFTAVVILMLMEDGQLELDDPLSHHLSQEIYQGLLIIDGVDCTGQITVRQLLNHRSGLGDYWFDPPYNNEGLNPFTSIFLEDVNRLWDPLEILQYARQIDGAGRPGDRYNYSDTNFLLLGLIIEELTELELHHVYRQRILDPLEMNETWLLYREEIPTGGTLSHRYEDEVDLYGNKNLTADWAGGGLVSSNRDLSRFLFGLAEGELLGREAMAAMMDWVPTGEVDVSYGLGLVHLKLDDELGELWGHDGHGNSFMYYWPQKQLAVVGTLNQTENDWWPLVEELIIQIGY